MEMAPQTENPSVGNVWSKFDISKLRTPNTKVEFYAPEVKDGEVYARLSLPDVRKEIDYWGNAVVVSVLGVFPSFHVMNGYLRRIWKEYEIDKILQVQKGVFLVRFGPGTQRDEVLKRGTPTFDRKPVVIVPWQENMELKLVQQTNVWIQFPSLPLKYWGTENLCRLASQVGVPIDIDEMTLRKDRGQFARVQVQVEIKEDVAENVKYLDEKERLCEQVAHYEWLPVICGNCKSYGHMGKDCRK